MSCKFQRKCNLQVFILNVRVASHELNLELQFSKKFGESNFETASYYRFLQLEILNCMLSKPLRITEK